MAQKDDSTLNDKQKRFCEEYVIDWNATRAAIAAGYSEHTAKQMGYENLTKPYIADYIEEIQKDLSKLAGISALRNILELKKMAYTNIADFKKDWLTLEEFNELDEDTKAAISEIQHTETTFGENGKKETIKFKLHDKQKALEILNRMLGWNAPDKSDITTKGESIIPQSPEEREKEIEELIEKAKKK